MTRKNRIWYRALDAEVLRQNLIRRGLPAQHWSKTTMVKAAGDHDAKTKRLNTQDDPPDYWPFDADNQSQTENNEDDVERETSEESMEEGEEGEDKEDGEQENKQDDEEEMSDRPPHTQPLAPTQNPSNLQIDYGNRFQTTATRLYAPQATSSLRTLLNRARMTDGTPVHAHTQQTGYINPQVLQQTAGRALNHYQSQIQHEHLTPQNADQRSPADLVGELRRDIPEIGVETSAQHGSTVVGDGRDTLPEALKSAILAKHHEWLEAAMTGRADLADPIETELDNLEQQAKEIDEAQFSSWKFGEGGYGV